jgi:hypothetical protein
MDVQTAMKSPGAVFGDPEVLEGSREFTPEQKRAILLQWQNQLERLQSADDESMLSARSVPGANAECLRRVTNALLRLAAGASTG